MYKKLMIIQSELKAPKSQFNSFGKYHYRNVEDILEALKPLLLKNNCSLIVSDDIVMVGDRHYIKATVTFIDNETGTNTSSTGFAREEIDKKGMDQMQLTGATSSYARKYALNGMFAIDDTKDSDTTNTHDKTQYQPQQTKPQQSTNTSSEPKMPSDAQMKRMRAIATNSGKSDDEIKSHIATTFNKHSSKELTVTELNKLIDWLEGK